MEPLVLSLIEIVCKNNVNGYNKIMSLLQKNNIITNIDNHETIIKKNIIKDVILHILDTSNEVSNNLQLELLSPLQSYELDNNLQLLIPNQYNYNRYNNYIEICELGSGSYGHVYKTYHNFEQNYYAIKKIELTEQIGEIDKNAFREIQLFSKLEHPNIVRYYSSWIYNTTLYIQMELCDYTLRHYIDNLMMDDDMLTRCKYFNYIIKGIQYLHNNNIIHRDIKPSNIMFKNGHVKICDFGLSRYISKNNSNSISKNNSNSISKKINLIMDNTLLCGDNEPLYNDGGGDEPFYNNDVPLCNDGDCEPLYNDCEPLYNDCEPLKNNKIIIKNDNLSLTCDVGSSIYRAPELEREYKYYNNKIDVYSLGIIFIEMLLVNYKTQHEKYKYITAIINSRKKPLPYLITNNFDDIIINMICKNHNKRLSINDITIIYKDNTKICKYN
jgi:serine/threonine protein kinase